MVFSLEVKHLIKKRRKSRKTFTPTFVKSFVIDDGNEVDKLLRKNDAHSCTNVK